MAEALRFLTHENPRLFHLLAVVAGMNLTLSALFVVGLPFLVKVHLGLSAQLYGFAEAALGLGSVLGGLLSGAAARWFGFERAHLFLGGTVLLLLPVVLALALKAAPLVAYGVLVASMLLGMSCAALFSITAQTYLQQQTPAHLLGKVGAFVSTICVCALPAGQALYGGLFDLFRSAPWAVVLLGGLASLALVGVTRGVLQGAARP